MKPANYAPVYAGLYPELAEIARKHGYAMAVHGSFARDADLICIPWADDASEPQAVVDAITSEFVIRNVGEPSVREHGRIVYTLTVSAPGCFIDLSFTPATRSALYASPAPDAVEPVAWVRMKTLDPSKPLKATTIKDIADGWMKAGHKVKPLVIRSALHTSPVSAPGVVEKLEQLPRYAETTAPGPRGSDSVVAEMTRDPHGEWLDRDEVLAALQEGK